MAEGAVDERGVGGGECGDRHGNADGAVDATEGGRFVHLCGPALLLEDTGTVSDTKSGIDWYNTTYNWMQGRISVERQSTTNSFDMVFDLDDGGRW